MYSKKILTCMGRLKICSQNNQYDHYWNFFWFQMRQLWKFQQLLKALIYETVTLWPWQVTVQLFNEHLALRTSYFMLLVEGLNLNFCPVFWIWYMAACVRLEGERYDKNPKSSFNYVYSSNSKTVAYANFLFLFLKSLLVERKLVNLVEILRFSLHQWK